MATTYKAFVSSSHEDLKAHRAYVIESLRRSGVFVDPMQIGRPIRMSRSGSRRASVPGWSTETRSLRDTCSVRACTPAPPRSRDPRAPHHDSSASSLARRRTNRRASLVVAPLLEECGPDKRNGGAIVEAATVGCGAFREIDVAAASCWSGREDRGQVRRRLGPRDAHRDRRCGTFLSGYPRAAADICAPLQQPRHDVFERRREARIDRPWRLRRLVDNGSEMADTVGPLNGRPTSIP